MLKALELSGFKSFADKTRFEFPPGITVVVGPNGSGKSNIVDAIKWVLGEQSAKSLRGKDMSDVIFKGSSGANSRRPSNAAQATLVLDNTSRTLAFDADEVNISRRVYRSGDTEYLINDETARLKDIKNLIRGTGVGTDAYSLIEQGKVERMLSTSPKERRAIFEEAAGISRFKAKKVEAERRLGRVQGNLIRLADIVEEVGSRYRSVKAQASRAARYREFSDRLKHLRTFTGVKDWQTFSDELRLIEATVAEQSEIAKEHAEFIETESEKTKKFESNLDALTEKLNAAQERSASVREELAQNDSQLQINRSRLVDIDQRKEELNQQTQQAAQRKEELAARVVSREKELEEAEIAFRDASDQLKTLETEHATTNESLLAFRNSSDSRRAEYRQLADLVTEIGRIVSANDSKLQSTSRDRERLEGVSERLSANLSSLEKQHAEVVREQQNLKTEAERTDGRLAEARKSFEQYKSELSGRKERLSDLRTQQSGLTQRAEVIEELEKSLEGVNAGARELIRKTEKSREGYLNDVIGLVADLVSVNVQHASIVDVALGELAQYVVVDGRALVDELTNETLKLDGRVGIIQLDSPPSLGTDTNIDLTGKPGIIGRADELVQVDARHSNFAHQLLGGTWVCKTLSDAVQLHNTISKQVRFVTLDGEIVESDGTILAGPKSVTGGLVSRRSELRAIKKQLIQLTQEIETCEQQVAELVELESTAEGQVQQLIEQNSGLSSGLLAMSEKSDQLQGRIGSTRDELSAAQTELQQTVSSLDSITTALDSEKQKLAVNELAASQLAGLIEVDDTEAKSTQAKRDKLEKQLTQAKVELGKFEQRLESLQVQLTEDREAQKTHEDTASQLTTRISDDAAAREAAVVAIEEAETAITKLGLEKDEIADQLAALNREKLELDGQRREITNTINQRRDLLRQSEDKLNQAKLRTEQIAMQRGQLLERMQEDYDIDLESLESFEANEEEELDLENERQEIDREIADLRKKLGQIGSVNLDALNELEELESRYNHLNSQYEDLVQAKETLEKIIVRINADSRKLFVETLEAIRQNFQKLFRQTFGGGQADIILEADVDPLDAGVEIVATPPGKSQFNNSLLSGGEKALTAVSLLMAIFQFRPSPFCVLDEVDAPFDEANIGRFIDVLKSFLGWTKFVIVTHSKKTMTAATTLYGITMQESGVSKRVSVRFEDVSDDGEISEDAIRRDDEDAA
jgi:chromosome segregation protein